MPPVKPLISVIIINWNGLKYLETCLSSLYAQEYQNLEVIIVDNASNDGSVEYLTLHFPQVKICKNDKNLGYAEANNVGYRVTTGEYVLFLNNDTEVSPTFITNLLVYFQNPKTGCAQSKLPLFDERSTLDSAGSFLTNTGFLYHNGHHQKDSSKYDKTFPIYTAKGASMMVPRKVLEKTLVDGEIFDSRFFAYCEETDLCHRIWLAGYQVVYAPDSVVYHMVGATSSRLDNSFVQYHSFKNRINSYVKNLGATRLFYILPIHLALCVAISAGFLFTGRPKTCFAVLGAIWWNITNLPLTLAKRRHIQHKIREAKDKQFFAIILRKVPLKYFYYLFRGLENYQEPDEVAL